MYTHSLTMLTRLCLLPNGNLTIDWNCVKLAKQMKTPILIDGRNVFSPQEANDAGFYYIGVGKGSYQNLF